MFEVLISCFVSKQTVETPLLLLLYLFIRILDFNWSFPHYLILRYFFPALYVQW